MFYNEEHDEDMAGKTFYGEQNNDNCLLKGSDFISKPIKSVRCTMDGNILQLQYPLSDQNSIFCNY